MYERHTANVGKGELIKNQPVVLESVKEKSNFHIFTDSISSNRVEKFISQKSELNCQFFTKFYQFYKA